MKVNFSPKDLENIDHIGDNHIGTSSDTPIREDAFILNSDEKIEIIRDDVLHIMETLGLDLTDDSLQPEELSTSYSLATKEPKRLK